MFDIGFSELVLIAVVALIVIGPERLPKVARTTGHLLGRLQRYVSDVKADIQREMHLEEMRKLQTTVEDSARELELSINKEVGAVETSVNQAAQPESPVQPALPQAAAPADTSAPASAAAPNPAADATSQMELTLDAASPKKPS